MNSGDRIDFPVVHDQRGNLSFLEARRHVPFDIHRVYWLYDVPGGADRGGHAHLALQQVMIAMAGSFDLLLDDGREKRRIHLNRSNYGIFIGPGVWREMDNFSSGSVCLVIASLPYDEADYIREYEAFLEYIRQSRAS